MSSFKHIVSVGNACTCAFMLKDLGLKLKSYPFDWIISPQGMVEDCITTDFKDYLDSKQFYHTDDREGTTYCHHKKYGTNVFHHRCPLHNPEDFAYLQRCVDRFRLIFDARSKERVLFVYVAEKQPEFASNCRNMYEALKPCSFLAIECLEEQAQQSVKVEEADHYYTRITVSCTSKRAEIGFVDAIDNENIATCILYIALENERAPTAGATNNVGQ